MSASTMRGVIDAAKRSQPSAAPAFDRVPLLELPKAAIFCATPYSAVIDA